MIVLADADLEIASSAAVWGSFTNCGQACLSVERIYVERAIAAKFTDLCVQKTKQLRIGPASDPDVPDVEVGPMIRLSQLEKVEEQLRESEQRGATILAGGIRRLDLGPNSLRPHGHLRGTDGDPHGREPFGHRRVPAAVLCEPMGDDHDTGRRPVGKP